jgi:hypothetical protein
MLGMKLSWVAVARSGWARAVGVVRERVGRAQVASFPVWDERFHASYARLRESAARTGPVLVLIGDAVILLDGDRRLELPANVPANRILKAASHIPVGVFTTLHECAEPLDELTLRRLGALQYVPACGQDALATLDAEARAEVETLLQKSRVFVEQVSLRRLCSPEELTSFANELGPLLLGLIERATHLELAVLHTSVEALLRQLSERGREQLEVVVAGVHQARARNLGLQYFKRRFAEALGDDTRVTYAESATDEYQAQALIGTRRVDRALAAAFFGDPNRMQRDLLGDAATRALANLQL